MSDYSLLIEQLRNRLLDTSKRNRLLYFKFNQRTFHLTQASTTKANSKKLLLNWNGLLSTYFTQSKPIDLVQYCDLSQSDIGILDKIRQENNRQIQEYGISQLYVVVAFIHWFPSISKMGEALFSPLLMVATTLSKTTKSIDLQYNCSATENYAQVNPMVVYQLKQQFSIQLPETVALNTRDIEDFFLHLTNILATSHIRLSVDVSTDVECTFPRIPTLDSSLNFLKATEKDWLLSTEDAVLGLFNHRKMSLLRDYDQMQPICAHHPVFNELFATKPKDPIKTSKALPEIVFHNQYLVVNADSTQLKAIHKAREGNSYHIQGPPGTGKSQVITNLIAQFTAEGKSVLFVCEKRAALDVVYRRLQQCGLDTLCAYIHDTKIDKKQAFISQLKETASQINANADPLNVVARRTQLGQKIAKLLSFFEEYRNAIETIINGVSVDQIIEKAIETKPYLPKEFPNVPLPDYGEWLPYQSICTDLGNELVRLGLPDIFAYHPFSKLLFSCILKENPLSDLRHTLATLSRLYEQLSGSLKEIGIPEKHSESLAGWKKIFHYAILLAPLASSNQLFLINKTHPSTRKMERMRKNLLKKAKELENICLQNTNWKLKLTQLETMEALSIAKKWEQNRWRWLQPKWWKTKALVDENFHFVDKERMPSYVTILSQLATEWEIKVELDKLTHEFANTYAVVEEGIAWRGVEKLRVLYQQQDSILVYLTKHKEASRFISEISGLSSAFFDLENCISRCLSEDFEHTIPEIISLIKAAIEVIENQDYQKLFPYLKVLSAAPINIRKMVCSIPFSPKTIDAAIVAKTLTEFMHENPRFAAMDYETISANRLELTYLIQGWRQLGGPAIVAHAKTQYHKHSALSIQSVNANKVVEKLWLKEYREGKKILEKEWNKSVRYKSIRELCELNSRHIIRDLKPIWLMSPLSVSDCFPLKEQQFDVIIFDEASQITLEEAVPALLRAGQMIVVGDDKQMAPSQFFQRNKSTNPILTQLLPPNESLLSIATKRLDGVLLQWHYRSRHEALINFSNKAFYNGLLYTIPDKHLPHTYTKPVLTNSPENIENDSVLRSSISFHYLPNAVYQDRTNRAEAMYITQLLRNLLETDTKQTIGIVAFSEEQQQCILNEIETKAIKDENFKMQLSIAFKIQHNGQYEGLFIKNVETIQGDERDIIIISICYGKNAQQKMRMNFGAVNRTGGEKRLNVLFTRAKTHVAVISSITHNEIREINNQGVMLLRQYLEYTSIISLGKYQEANNLLQRYYPNPITQSTRKLPFWVQQLGNSMKAFGYEIDYHIGQSGFTIPIAIRKNKNNAHYTLGIITYDTMEDENVLDVWVQCQAILEDFGWKIIMVTAKNWLEESETVLAKITQLLSSSGSIVIDSAD